MIYSRNLFEEAKKNVKERPATVITGMRMVGKSTLLKELLEMVPGKNKIDLERVEKPSRYSSISW